MQEEIINFVAERKLTKFVQALEIGSFLISGFLLNTRNGFIEASIMLLVGIFLAIVASTSAIVEYENKIGDKKVGSK